MTDRSNVSKAKDFLGHAMTSTIISAVAGGLISWPISYRVAMSTIGPSQDRQMRLEQVTSFSAAADEFLTLGVQIVPRLNVRQPLDEAKLAIVNASGRQAVNVQGLIDAFGPSLKPEAFGYQSALNEFVKTTNALQSPGQIKDWVTAYDGVLVAQHALKSRMYVMLDIKTGMDAASSL